MLNRLWFGFALLALPLTACDEKDRCKASPECLKQGKCTADDKGACAVASSRDCQDSEACKLHGQCSAKAGACTVANDTDCTAADDCKKLEMCSAYNGSCVNLKTAIHTECAKSCGAEGLCVTQGGHCVALSRQHCSGTAGDKPEPESACAKLGHCTPKDGRCVAGSDDDCAKSEVCKTSAQCAAHEGRCEANGEACKKSDACERDGKCGVKDGLCVSVSDADCRKSSRCKLEGACSRKENACAVGSSADCAQSTVCAQVKYCLAKDGVCVASGGGRGAAKSGDAPDKVGKTTIDGVWGL